MEKQILQNSRILIVDDQPPNVLLLERALKDAGYRNVTGITDAREVLKTFAQFHPDLVALDLRMPHLDGYDLLRQLPSLVPSGSSVPVLVLTADDSRKAKQEALALGAKDFLTKPIDLGEALLRIYNLLETRWLHVALQLHGLKLEENVRCRTEELEQTQLEILQRLALAAEYRDDSTGQHAQRVGEWAALLGKASGLSKEHVDLIRLAAPLHDIGKIGIPDSILLKPGKLTSEEYSHIKHHADIGRRILSGGRFAILQMAERIAHYHHERWDGGGYYGLQGDAIPLEARIVSIADTFDVITHARLYKDAASVEVALDVISQEKGKQFDPELATMFIKLQPTRGLFELNDALNDQAVAHERISPSPALMI